MPMFRARRQTLALLLPLAAACASFDDEIDAPTPLADFDATVSVSSQWSAGVSDSEARHFSGLRPAHAKGVVYIADYTGVITALDSRDGDILWRADTELRLGGGPGVGGGIIVAASREGEVVALDTAAGEELWRAQVTSEVLSVPVIAAGVAVVGAIDGRLFGLSTADGKRLWTYDRSVPALTLRGNSSPALVGGMVVYGSDSGKVSALSLKEGLPVWEKSVAYPSGRSELDRIVDIDGDPLVIGGIVYAASYQGAVVALDLETGATVWSKEIAVAANMSADKTNIYVTDRDGNVWALDRRTGTAVWKQDKLLHRQVTGSAVSGDYVIVADYDGYLHWLSTIDGGFAGRVRADNAAFIAPPVVADGLVYSYSAAGELSAFTVE